MAKLSTTLIAGCALLAIAGCAKKRPAVLPPAPADSASEAPLSGSSSGVDANGAIQPGSDADFRRSVQSNTVNFAVDAYDIDPTARGILDSQVGWLQRYGQVRVTIEGHCDESGTREYNLALGDRRANAAKNYLVARGIAADRITTISYGKERPLALGSDPDSYAQNRRAVTVVLGR